MVHNGKKVELNELLDAISERLKRDRDLERELRNNSIAMAHTCGPDIRIYDVNMKRE